MNNLPTCYQVKFMLENIKLGISVWNRRSNDEDWYRYRKIYDYGMENYFNLQKILSSNKINEKDAEGKTLLHVLLKFFDESYHIRYPDAGCNIGQDILNLINNPMLNIKYEYSGLDYLEYIQGLYFFQDYDDKKESSSLENKIINSIASRLEKKPNVEIIIYDSD